MKKLLMPGISPGLLKLVLPCFLFLFSTILQAQTISGTVTDEGMKKLSGVSITVKGSSVGTFTDASGQYQITAASNATLVFSYIGSKTLEEKVESRSIVNAIMSTTGKNMDEVVVSALGITKQKRGIGYSATNVKPEDLTIARTTNPINAIQGKVAGVVINTLGTGPASTSKIRIRGQSSLGGGNSPLIVINGVPIDNTNFNGNTVGVPGGGMNADGGDGLSSINPDDIESMTILKGAAASALYGSRAKDGVIMIQTKTKGKGKGLGVSYNFNYGNEAPLDYTDYQNVYGQGENGVRPTTPNPTSGQWSFGEQFAPGMTQTLYNTPNIPYEPQGSRINEFYRHGQNMANTVTLSTSGDKGGIHLSLTDIRNKGIVTNNQFVRNGVNLGFGYDLSEHLSFSGSINYTREVNTNPPNIAQQDNSIPTTMMALANSMPLSVFDANKYNADGNEYPYSRFANRTNAYWILAEQFNNINRDRLYGNVAIKYKFNSWLSLQGRIGTDYWSRAQDYNNYPTGQASRGPAPAGFVNGVYTQESRRFNETNADFLAIAAKKYGDFDITLTGGGNQLRRHTEINNVQVTDFVIRDLYTVQNGRAKNPVYSLEEKQVNSLYGSAEVSWKRMLYLNATARNDWFSTLSPENRSILYPSISGSFVFTEILNDVKWLNFGKLRVGYAQVGSDNDIAPYANQLFYNVNANLIGNPAGTLVALGTSGTTIPNPDLRPSSLNEIELGMELKMFDSRVNLDVAVYKRTTFDQIVGVQVSNTSGFLNTRINSGESQNKGFEALLTLIPVQNKDFSWDFTANTAYNITKVISIVTNTPGERVTVGTHVFNGELRNIVGEEMGQLAGRGYAVNAKGERIFQSNGVPLSTDPNVLVNFGSALPKWTGGFLNTLKYKNMTFAIFIDYRLGGKMISGTNFNAIRHGLHQMTLDGRVGGVVGVGVNQSGGENTVATPVQTYWEHVRTQQIIQAVIYNSGYWKIRSMVFGYNFSNLIPAKWPITGLQLDLYANNVLMIKKWVDNIDPESFGYAADSQAGLESPGLPTTRGVGINLNIKF